MSSTRNARIRIPLEELDELIEFCEKTHNSKLLVVLVDFKKRIQSSENIWTRPTDKYGTRKYSTRHDLMKATGIRPNGC